MRLYLIICIFICMFTKTPAQDANSDFLKLNEAYFRDSLLSMKVSHLLYPNYTATQPYEVYNGFFKRKGSLMHTRVMDVETMQNTDYRVVIDESNKLMVVADPAASQSVPTLEQIGMFMQLPSAITFEETKKSKVYKLEFKNKYIEADSIEIHIDKSTYLLNKIVMYLRESVTLNPDNPAFPEEQPRVEVLFSEVNLNPELDASASSESRYFTMQDGGYTCSIEYKSYKIVNQKLRK